MDSEIAYLNLHRRSRAAMKALREQMQALESVGRTRKQIALELRVTPAQVTRGLGAVKPWKWKRMRIAA